MMGIFSRACVFCVLMSSLLRADDHSTTAPVADLILWHDEHLECVSIDLSTTEHNPATAWQLAFRRLFEFADINNDSQLDAEEQARLPTPAALRQSAWSPFSLMLRRSPPPTDWDTNGDGRLVLDEMTAGYRRAGLGTATVAVGYPPDTNRLSLAVIAAIDRDHDGKTTAEEWKQADSALLRLDSNQDGLVGPGELVNHCVYPGASGSILWNPASQSPLLRQGGPQTELLLLPAHLSDAEWGEALLARWKQHHTGMPQRLGLQSSPASTPAETSSINIADTLTAWRHAADRPRWTVAPPGTPPTPPAAQTPTAVSKTISAGRLQVRLESRPGRLPDLVARGRGRMEAAFKEHDPDNNGSAQFVVRGTYESEIMPFHEADRNHDERLSRAEFTQWLELHEAWAKAQIVVTVLDWGPGLYETLDTNRDGSLSLREMRKAWGTLQESQTVEGDQFVREQLPHHVTLVLSQGHPVSLLSAEASPGPAWFRSMDRNRDGDISAAEFLGASERFKKLDRDGDGLLNATEASATE